MTRITNQRMILQHTTLKTTVLTIMIMSMISRIITFNLVTGMATDSIGDGTAHIPVLHLDTDIMTHFISTVTFIIRTCIQHGVAHTALLIIHMADTIIIITVHITIIHTIIIQITKLFRDITTLPVIELETITEEEDLITPGLESLLLQLGPQNV